MMKKKEEAKEGKQGKSMGALKPPDGRGHGAQQAARVEKGGHGDLGAPKSRLQDTLWAASRDLFAFSTGVGNRSPSSPLACWILAIASCARHRRPLILHLHVLMTPELQAH